MEYSFLFDVALILLSTKLLSMFTKRINMPQVVGALMAGLILGPAVLNILHRTEFIQQISSMGVIILMFCAGLETDIKELKKTGKASFVIALLGVIMPLIGGFAVSYFFNTGELAQAGSNAMLQNVFIGIILTATSVSITVETLKEMGKLNTKAGNAILGAALIDDILGIIGLTIVTSLADTSVDIFMVIIKIVAFFVLAAILGIAVHWAFCKWIAKYGKDMRRFVIVAFVFCLLLAFVAEQWFGVADITGAFIAGLIISNTQETKYIASRFETLSYMFLSPIFFASIGLQVEVGVMSGAIIIFSVLLLIVAVISKIIGCGLGAKLCKFSNEESLQIGTGMISRGEVALIVATKGERVGLMNPVFFAPILITVVVTTIVTPILLKLVFKKKDKNDYSDLVTSELVEHYEETANLDDVAQDLLEINRRLKK